MYGVHGMFSQRRPAEDETEECGECRFCGGTCSQHHVWDCPAAEGDAVRRNVQVAMEARKYVSLDDVIR